MTGIAWCEAIKWTAARQIAISSEINTWKNTSLLGLLGKAYVMTLVVIVGDYSVFVSKASLRRIDETNVAAFKTIRT